MIISFVVLFSFSSWVVSPYPIDNFLEHQPVIHCGSEGVTVEMHSAKPFRGRLFVEGEAEDPHCSRMPKDTTSLEFSLSYGDCGMRRQRSLQPRGVEFSFTLVVSFHPLFLTGVDRAFTLRCFFVETVKKTEWKLDVGHLTTETIRDEYPVPPCKYLLTAESGEVLHFARVGDPVIHVWECANGASDVYGMLIHSCQIDDGHGNSFTLVDEKGCSVDEMLLPQVVYQPHSLSASAHSQIFKYADKIQMYFTCTVQLCFKQDGGCSGITPPECHGKDFPLHVQHPHSSEESAELGHGHGHPEIHEGPKHFEGARAAAAPLLTMSVNMNAPTISTLLLSSREHLTTSTVSSTSSEVTEVTEAEKTTATITNSTAKDTNGTRPRLGRDLNNLQSDLTTDLLVLPFNNDNQRAVNPFQLKSPLLCASQFTAIMLGISIISLMILTSLSTVIVLRSCHKSSLTLKK